MLKGPWKGKVFGIVIGQSAAMYITLTSRERALNKLQTETHSNLILGILKLHKTKREKGNGQHNPM